MYVCIYIYIGRGCDTVLNMHAQTQDKSDYLEGTFGEELEQMFFHFLQDHIKIMSGGFHIRTVQPDINHTPMYFNGLF